VSSEGDYVDIPFSNIRHAFFDKQEHGGRCMLHFHLEVPIPVGRETNSKHYDIQFVCEIFIEPEYVIKKDTGLHPIRG
jgi:nucleosome binding factor SPN SPT16 subunit